MFIIFFLGGVNNFLVEIFFVYIFEFPSELLMKTHLLKYVYFIVALHTFDI